jgi:hypothetical protein
MFRMNLPCFLCNLLFFAYETCEILKFCSYKRMGLLLLCLSCSPCQSHYGCMFVRHYVCLVSVGVVYKYQGRVGTTMYVWVDLLCMFGFVYYVSPHYVCYTG